MFEGSNDARKVLAIGVSPDVLAGIYMQCSVFAISIESAAGGTLHFEKLGSRRYDDLIVDVERCLSFPPVIVQYLQTRGCFSDCGLRVAIADSYPLALKDQLVSSGIKTCAYKTTWREEFSETLTQHLAASKDRVYLTAEKQDR